MESLLPLIINAVLGGGGGFIGNMIKKNGMSLVANLLSGAVGGSILPQIMGMVMGGGADAAGAAAEAGAMDPMSMVSALVGGGAGSMLAGLLGGKKEA